MANFGQLIMTNKGKEAQAQVQYGKPLKFKRIALGSGTLTGSIATLTKLIDEKASVAVGNILYLNNTYTVDGYFDNQALLTGFYWREIGVFIQDPNNVGAEILYCYANAGEQGDYIPSTEDEKFAKYIRVQTLIDNAQNISITESEGLLYVDTITFGNYKNETSQRFDATKEELQKLIDTKEPKFNKNTAFNKNFGTVIGTVCEGNDKRLSDSRNAKDVYSWAKEPTKPSYDYSEIQGKPSSFTPSSHSHSFSAITNKPTTYTPSAHNHTKAEITDFPVSMPASDVKEWAKAENKPTYSYSEIQEKPSSFPPSVHNHDDRYFTQDESTAKFATLQQLPSEYIIKIQSTQPSAISGKKILWIKL